jgi:hypothetical protein
MEPVKDLKWRLGRTLAFAAAAVAAAASPAEAGKAAEMKAANVQPAVPCGERVFAPVFAPWHDRALYTLAPGGDFETAAAGWTLAGPAVRAAGSAPFLLGPALGASSLQLAAGASAVSAPICVGHGFPSFRFAARGANAGELAVEVVYASGEVKPAGRLTLGRDWAVTRKLSLAQGRFGVQQGGSTLIRLRFAATAGAVRVDDVYVDPRYHR